MANFVAQIVIESGGLETIVCLATTRPKVSFDNNNPIAMDG